MKKAVLIEDSKALASALVGALKIEGIEVCWAPNGVDGVAAVKREKPAIVLLDLMLPRLSGFDVCRLLKTDASVWRIPVVVMSTLADEQSRQRALEAGADFFIPKPYDLFSTIAAIKKILRV